MQRYEVHEDSISFIYIVMEWIKETPEINVPCISLPSSVSKYQLKHWTKADLKICTISFYLWVSIGELDCGGFYEWAPLYDYIGIIFVAISVWKKIEWEEPVISKVYGSDREIFQFEKSIDLFNNQTYQVSLETMIKILFEFISTRVH